jgi:hypothetical protein
MEINAITPPTVGWLEGKLDENAVEYLWKCIDNKEGSEKRNLAGNIDASYRLIDKDDWFFHHVVYPFMSEYNKQFYNLGNSLPTNARHPYFLQKLWVNYQQENEFNPLHDHTGIYSFVIWMKIPTNHFDQNKNPISLDSNSHKISVFDFQYTDMLGSIRNYSYEMSPKVEGTMLFFPATLKHQVYPFYNCKDTRITISGNVCLDTSIIQSEDTPDIFRARSKPSTKGKGFK